MLNLNQFDKTIDESLQEPYSRIQEKSKALAISLKRCFEEARNSRRFEEAYQAGLEGKYQNLSTDELLKQLTIFFEEEDFMSFREFVRLLRACSLHIGGEVSGQIREAYNKTSKGERLLLAYNQGLNYNKLS
jgi:hypothetical protein